MASVWRTLDSDPSMQIFSEDVNFVCLCADSRWSAIGFSIVSPIFIAWLLTFSLGYDKVFPKSMVDKLDVSDIDLRLYWLF
jgi:hypothetical protein